MSVLRHYFISDNLDDLGVLEQELEQRDVDTEQIHVLSIDDSGTENHVNLNDVTSLMKRDVIRTGELGLLLGVVGAIIVLGGAYLLDLTGSGAGWIPFIFLAIIVLGFCTWEGGFIGIQRTNANFKRFEEVLNQGKHVFFVDLLETQESILDDLLKRHPSLELAGVERGTPAIILKGQKKIPHFLRETLP